MSLLLLLIFPIFATSEWCTEMCCSVDCQSFGECFHERCTCDPKIIDDFGGDCDAYIDDIAFDSLYNFYRFAFLGAYLILTIVTVVRVHQILKYAEPGKKKLTLQVKCLVSLGFAALFRTFHHILDGGLCVAEYCHWTPRVLIMMLGYTFFLISFTWMISNWIDLWMQYWAGEGWCQSHQIKIMKLMCGFFYAVLIVTIICDIVLGSQLPFVLPFTGLIMVTYLLFSFCFFGGNIYRSMKEKITDAGNTSNLKLRRLTLYIFGSCVLGFCYCITWTFYEIARPNIMWTVGAIVLEKFQVSFWEVLVMANVLNAIGHAKNEEKRKPPSTNPGGTGTGGKSSGKTSNMETRVMSVSGVSSTSEV